jgi:CheY-like chemotaxis protein/HPt (histidine-containing phosphotransfer) domain-containing protein
MMLSSADQSGDASRCRELGIACYLRKPITQSDLFDAILTAMGAEPAGDEARVIEAASDRRSLRILLAEDNEINQELAVRSLKKRGHSIVVAVNGVEALAVLEQQTIDLVLMDIQMPVMDGLAATAAIREREKAGGTHIPIVALTAHAMTGDRERCLAAGMDAYISKPLRVKELMEVIARLIPVAPSPAALWPATPAPAALPLSAADPGPAFDPAWALEQVEGDRKLLREMIDLFSKQARQVLLEIRDAGQRGDGRGLERAAHRLKGSIGHFGDHRASHAALRLEIMGRDGDFALAEEACAELEAEVGRLRVALEAFKEEATPCAS